ncbi:MAG: hypothetical protein IV091_00785 [Polaromonas sp.]|jgi:hypothetical protein|nr:hypothetical protein [Polaromonas sp.]MBT9474368.1 hypothetical protein [Polaromonas sp.]
MTDLAGAEALDALGAVFLGFALGGVASTSALPVAASIFGIQRMNGVRSVTSTIYQSFLVASQRAPSAFAASFSENGVTKLILILRIIRCRARQALARRHLFIYARQTRKGDEF